MSNKKEWDWENQISQEIWNKLGADGEFIVKVVDNLLAQAEREAVKEREARIAQAERFLAKTERWARLLEKAGIDISSTKTE